MDDLIQERVTQKENELNAEYDERMRNYEEREKDLQRQVEMVKKQLRDLHMSNESAEAKLLNANQRQGKLPDAFDLDIANVSPQSKTLLRDWPSLTWWPLILLEPMNALQPSNDEMRVLPFISHVQAF